MLACPRIPCSPNAAKGQRKVTVEYVDAHSSASPVMGMVVAGGEGHGSEHNSWKAHLQSGANQLKIVG